MKTNGRDDSDQGDNPTKKRVNITIFPDVHRNATEEAVDQGVSFSQFVTDALIDAMEDNTGLAESDQIQSIIKRMDRLEEESEHNGNTLEQLHDTIEWIAEAVGPDNEQITSQIKDELDEADHPLSMADLTERLSMTPRETENGLRILNQQYAVNRLESANSETSAPRWELL